MTKTVKIILISALVLAMAALAFYGARFGKTPEEKLAENPAVSAEEALQTAIRLSSDAETARQGETSKHIALSDNGSTASASGIQIRGNTVTVTASGVYSVSGTLTEGQLAVDCDDTVVLILDGAEISNSSDAAINVSNAGHTLIYLPEGSANRLESGAEREITAAEGNTDVESAAGAALYARDSLSFAGSGKLTVGGYINNAVATTDHLIVLGGELELTAVNNGLKGKDSVTVLDGTITVCSGNDGIKSNNSVDADCGNIDIRGGEINIVSLGDGMQAERNLSVADGIITITAGDITSAYSEESIQSPENLPENMRGETEDIPMPQGGETPPNMPDGTEPGGFPQNSGGMSFPDQQGGMNPQGGGMPPDMPDGTEPGGFPQNSGGMGFPDQQGSMNPQGGETPPNMPDGTEPGGFPQNSGGMSFPDQQGGMNPQGGGRTDGRTDRPTDPSDKTRGDFPDMYDREWSYDSDSEGSTKGLKSGGDLTVSGGSITVNSVDDCIHADGSITVSGGTFLLSTGDDGFHADDTLTISDGAITVSQSYEGLEGHQIYLIGGDISVTASDDGINAGGGSSDMFGRMFGTSGSGDSSISVLKISGGTLCVNADGDGLDSNGDLIVEGGTIIVDGPTNSNNGALDSGTENGGIIVCNGGTILAIGASGMAESFESDSAQCSFTENFSGTMPAGTQITIADENGKTIFEHKSAKTFNSVVFSSPELVLGSTCTITVGDQTETISIENITNGGSSGSDIPGGPGGRFGPM